MPLPGSVVTSALTGVVDTITIMSRFSPPVTLKVADLLAEQEGPPHPAIRALQPTIILRGKGIGQQVIAPGGQATPEGWKLPAATAVTLVVVGALTALTFAYRVGQRTG